MPNIEKEILTEHKLLSTAYAKSHDRNPEVKKFPSFKKVPGDLQGCN